MVAVLAVLTVLLAPQEAPRSSRLQTELDSCPSLTCATSEVQSVYLRGWEAAREAARVGGPPESLAPVREAITTLEGLAGGGHGPAEISMFVLRAAADAAQDEREEMALFLAHAVDLERTQLDAGQPGAPGISAHEAAGELWFRVRRYEDALRAYQHARSVVGSTALIESGLARVNDALRR
jgi:hypothetical protein